MVCLTADVNGSAAYLFALLKMKLKMAARRKLARSAGVAAPLGGALSPREQALFEELEAILYESLGLSSALARAARATTARRDVPRAAALVREEFRARGRAVLGTANVVVDARAPC